jgi:hypothetical protein
MLAQKEDPLQLHCGLWSAHSVQPLSAMNNSYRFTAGASSSPTPPVGIVVLPRMILFEDQYIKSHNRETVKCAAARSSMTRDHVTYLFGWLTPGWQSVAKVAWAALRAPQGRMRSAALHSMRALSQALQRSRRPRAAATHRATWASYSRLVLCVVARRAALLPQTA